jgi:hypothetical protein
MFNNVDFPAPEGPITLMNSPFSMRSVTCRSTQVRPALVS